MPYDAKNVERLLDKMKALRDDRSDKTKAEFAREVKKLSEDDKYEVGANIIMTIADHAATLAPYEEYINKQRVKRSDLETKQQNPYVLQGCTWCLENLGFRFVKKVMDGDVGILVRKYPNQKKKLCEEFVGKLQPGNLIFAWTNALSQGFVINKKELDAMVGSQRTEFMQVNDIMKTAAEGIWSCVRDFKDLEIEIED
jgi:hypothetical protein